MPRLIALVQARNPRGEATVRAGFTLIELLVVIAIIAVIAAMLMPAIASVRHSALQTQCGSNLRQIFTGAMAYTDDYEGTLPPALLRIAAGHDQFWYDRLAPYFNVGIPNVSSGVLNYASSRSTLKRSVIWGCRNNPVLRSDPANTWNVGYGMNNKLGAPQVTAMSLRFPHTVPSSYVVFNVARLTHTSTRPLFGDSSQPPYLPNNPTPPRHKNLLSGVYCDGHVGYETLTRWAALRDFPQNQ